MFINLGKEYLQFTLKTKIWVLTTVENQEIVIRVEDEEFVFPIETIDKAKVVPQY